MSVRAMLQPAYQAVLEARTRDQFRREVIRFTRRCGFDTVTAMLVVDQSRSHSEFHTVDNAPDDYAQAFDRPELAQHDPVMQHCRQQSIPIIWDQATYVEVGQGAKWETQASFGFRAGVALALHLPGNHHFCIGADRDGALPSKPTALTRMVADLQLFAVHAQDAAIHIFAPPQAEEAPTPALTPRELEALRWTMDGKLAREVGEALNVSERTAVFHLQNAARKLGCKSKYQAVLIAIRLGLII